MAFKKKGTAVSAKAAAKAAEKKSAPSAEEVAEKKAAADKAAAEKKAASEKKAAEAKAATAKKAAEAQRILEPIAKEILSRAASSIKQDTTADNHRISIGLALKKAEDTCKEMGMSFKAWYGTNVEGKEVGKKLDGTPITLGYESARKLLYIGRSDNPQLALEDLRLKVKENNKAHRARNAKASKPGRPAGGKSMTAPAAAPAVVAIDVLKAVAEPKRLEIIRDEAKSLGFVVTAKADGQGAAKDAFNSLSASDKMEFLKWAAFEVGATVDFSFKSAPANTEEPELPPILKK